MPDLLGIGDDDTTQGRISPLLIQPPDQPPLDTTLADAHAANYQAITGMLDKARNLKWSDVTDYASQFLPSKQSVGNFTSGILGGWLDRDVVVPEGAQPVMLDSGPGYQLKDGSYLRKDQLPQRSAVLPLSEDKSDPKATAGLVLSTPGVLQLLPALGTEAGALEGGEEGVTLGAGARRRSRPAEPPPEAPPPPEPNPRAGIGGNQPPPDARLTMSPEAFSTQMSTRGGLLDEGVPTRSANVLGGGREGTMMGVPNLRNMSQPDAIATAQAEPHLIAKDGGGYVGAPANIQDADDLAAMRRNFDAAVNAGVGGADWYERAQDWVSRVSGGDPVKMRQLAERLGITSPQSNPASNLAFTVTGANALARGIPADVTRTGAQALQMNRGAMEQAAAVAAGEPFPNIEQGLKTGPFTQNLDPTARPGTTGVNDIWHARTMGYTDPDGSPFDSALSPQQHTFMDYETMLAVDRANERQLGGRSNWTAAEIQAAPWVANKAASLAQRYPKWTPEQIWEEANATFPDRAQTLTGSVPHEQVPGSVTGLTTGSMTPEAFTRRANWIDPNTGQDVLLAHDLGLITDRTQIAPGVYTNAAGQVELNPVHVGQGLLDLKPLPEGSKEARSVQPGTAAALDTSQAVRGLLDFQEGNPWSYVRTTSPGADANSVKITLGRQPTRDEMSAVSDLAATHNLIPSNTADGIALLDPGEGRTGAQVGKLLRGQGGLEDQIRSILPGEGVYVERGANLGGYVDLKDQLDQAVAGQGQATQKVFGYLDNLRTQAPAMYDRLMSSPELAAKAQANLARLQESGQLGVRPDYEELLRLVAGGKLSGLQARIQREGYAGLPAVGGQAGLVSAMLGASGSTSQETAQRQP